MTSLSKLHSKIMQGRTDYYLIKPVEQNGFTVGRNEYGWFIQAETIN